MAATIRGLEGQIKDLKAIIDQLLGKHQPPREEASYPPAPDKKPSGRKRGGQPGHPPHLRKLLPPEAVTETVSYRPEQCSKCQSALPVEAGPNDPEPYRHQVAELPKLVVRVVEHQAHTRICSCGCVNRATIPTEILAHSMGPRLTGAIGYLTGSQGISKRGVEEIFESLWDVPISLGTISNREQEISQALATSHAEVLEAVQQADVKGADETGWTEQGQKRWLWIGVTQYLAVFLIQAWRNKEAMASLLGPMQGILVSDRWVVYRRWPDEYRRQLCWAHLKRNWEKLVERGGTARRIGEAFLEVQKQVFELWHRFQKEEISRAELSQQMLPLIDRFNEVLSSGLRGTDEKTRRFCTRLQEESVGLWTFVESEGVEPTNNHAERSLRLAVIWRRRSFGSQSAAGCQYVERILTAVQTLRLQKRNVLEFLTDTVQAHRNRQPTPKLLPQG